MIDEIIYLPDGLKHIKLTYSDDMELVDYSLYVYDNKNEMRYEYKLDGSYHIYDKNQMTFKYNQTTDTFSIILPMLKTEHITHMFNISNQ
jgi:hypothetical protein